MAATPPQQPVIILGHVIAPGQLLAAAIIASAYALYCVVTSRHVKGHIPRYRRCLLGSAAIAGIAVIWVDHAHHGKFAAAAAKTGQTTTAAAWYAWAALAVLGSVALFWAARHADDSGLSARARQHARRLSRRGGGKPPSRSLPPSGRGGGKLPRSFPPPGSSGGPPGFPGGPDEY